MRIQSSYSTALVCSVTLHAVLLALVIVGWTPEHKKTHVQPRYIKATLLQMEPSKAPPVKKQTATRTANSDQQKKRAAEKKKADARKRKEKKQRAEKKQSEERARKKRANQEKLRKQKLAEAKKQEEAKKQAEARKQAEAKKLAEAKKQAAENSRQKELELAFADALDDEEQFISAGQNEQLVGSYSDYIVERIANNWSRPSSARRGMEVVLSIQMVPTGQVVSVTVVKSSGNDAFDRSAEQAVYKVERFDKLQELSRAQPRVFESTFRRFRLLFRPDDLRL